MDYRVVIILSLEALLALWLLRREGLLKSGRQWALCLPLTLLAFGLRLICLDYKTLDYIDFLSRWVDFYRQNGGFKVFYYPLGNYNIPYLYFLCFFSYSSVDDLYLIKLLSIFFDVLLAYGAMKLLGLYKRSEAARIACFFAVLLLPTVVLNGSLWGQCDSIYVALAVLGLYLAMSKRPFFSVACFALSFGFKLQAVFMLPVMALLWFRGDYKLRHLLLFPVLYVVLVLPAVLMGKPFLDTLTLYASQTGSIGGGLNYNSPSVFGFFTYGLPNEALAARIGIIAAFAYMLLILAIGFVYRRRMSDRALLAAAVLLAVGIPFLLPHMHDRYFFAADIICLVAAFVFPYCLAMAPLAQFASLLGYHAYLKMRYLLLMYHGSRALIIVLLTAMAIFAHELEKSRNSGDFSPEIKKSEIS